MKFLLTLAALVAASASAAPIHSGHASAELITASANYQDGKPVEAAVRLRMDPGWHTYWTNPGEGGMELGLKWNLPEGWSAGDVGWPVPIRFKTGDLPGFGYVGELVLPVTLTPPKGSTGPANISVKLEWLTCNDEACIPGDAAPAIELKAGESSATPDAAAIAKVRAALPRPVEGLKLEVKEEGKNLLLSLTAPGNTDPAAFAVFPETPQVVDAGAVILFGKKEGGWSATVAKSEYLSEPLKEISLVLTGGQLTHPARVLWKKAE